MILLIIKILIIFIITNSLEQLFLFLFKVKPSIQLSILLNNIIGIIFLIIINYFKVFEIGLNLPNILIISSTGLIGLIGIFIHITNYL